MSIEVHIGIELQWYVNAKNQETHLYLLIIPSPVIISLAHELPGAILKLNAKYFKPIDVQEGDGNCFYRSLCQHLYFSKKHTHTSLPNDFSRDIRRSQAYYIPFSTTSIGGRTSIMKIMQLTVIYWTLTRIEYWQGLWKQHVCTSYMA